MMGMDERVRIVCCLLFTFLVEAAVTTSGASSPVWNLQNLTASIDHRWPVGRSDAALWLDPSSEHVWMFGGQQAGSETVTLDDLWMLDLATSKWVEIQRRETQWPSRWKRAVLSGAPNGILLAGGVTSDGIQRSDVWRYDLRDSSWRVDSRQGVVFGNATRFWSNGTELFGLTIHNSSAAFMLQYNLTEQSWRKDTIHNGSRTLPTRLAPDLNNMTHYPLWPSGEDYVIIYAPIKNYRVIDVQKEVHRPCILWILSKSLEWKPFVNDCELYKACPSVIPANLRTVEVIQGLPACRGHSATWMDAGGNLWMYGGISFREGEGLQDTWRFNRRTRSWKIVHTPCVNSQSSDDCKDSPGHVTDAMTWRVNNTLFLLGGHHLTSDPTDAASLKQIWSLDLTDYCDCTSLPVPPVGIFLIVLTAMIILSLVTCGIIIFAKCSSPLAPRIRPPARMYGQVRYSPVGSTDEMP